VLSTFGSEQLEKYLAFFRITVKHNVSGDSKLLYTWTSDEQMTTTKM